MTNAAVSSIYVVQIGDTLSKLALRFYGDAARATQLAQANGIGVNDILPFGKRLQIPSAQAQLAAPVIIAKTPEQLTDADMLPEQIVTAPMRSMWYQDWRVWTVAVLGAGLFLYLNNNRK